MIDPPRAMMITWTGPGHIWPYLNFARRLRNRGVTVYLVGFDDDVDRFKAYNFRHFSVGAVSDIRSRLENGTTEEKETFFQELVGKIDQAFSMYSPELLFIDPFSHLCAAVALRRGVEARYLWVFNPSFRGDGHHPFSKVRYWSVYRWLRPFPEFKWSLNWLIFHVRLLQKGVYEQTVFDLKIRPLAKSRGLDRVFASGGYLVKFPSVVLGPRRFSDSTSGQVLHLGLGVEPREEEDFPFLDGRRVVLVSFGSNFHLYDRAKTVLRNVVDVARQMPVFDFVFQVPANFRIPTDAPSNAAFHQRVPVFRILKRASLLITHGGFGGIKEAVFFKVPMLVVPFAFDQPGNAYHVEKEGIGLVVTPARASVRTLAKSITHLTEVTRFRTNLDRLSERLAKEDQTEPYISALIDQITSKRVE